jgi:hypothetical protein
MFFLSPKKIVNLEKVTVSKPCEISRGRTDLNLNVHKERFIRMHHSFFFFFFVEYIPVMSNILLLLSAILYNRLLASQHTINLDAHFYSGCCW